MKNLVFIALLAILFAACQENSANKAGHAASHQHGTASEHASVVALDVTVDPICEMEVTAESAADTAFYKGKVYGFCSEDCKAKFAAEPEKYVAN